MKDNLSLSIALWLSTQLRLPLQASGAEMGIPTCCITPSSVSIINTCAAVRPRDQAEPSRRGNHSACLRFCCHTQHAHHTMGRLCTLLLSHTKSLQRLASPISAIILDQWFHGSRPYCTSASSERPNLGDSCVFEAGWYCVLCVSRTFSHLTRRLVLCAHRFARALWSCRALTIFCFVPPGRRLALAGSDFRRSCDPQVYAFAPHRWC